MMGEIGENESDTYTNISQSERCSHSSVGGSDHHSSSVGLLKGTSSMELLSVNMYMVGSTDSSSSNVSPSPSNDAVVGSREDVSSTNSSSEGPAVTGLPVSAHSVGPATTTGLPLSGATAGPSTVVSNAGILLDLSESDQDSILLLEKRSFRPFKSAEDYLYAMREDLAEWLHGLYDLDINVDNFFEVLENGVLLCEHANNVKKAADEHEAKTDGPRSQGRKFSSRYVVPPYEVTYRRDSAPGSFFARDNIHNFICWCRDLGVHDVLMFETDDLVLRKNEKHVILALLEIARRGARFGMAAPLLVLMEEDIDKEIEKDRLANEDSDRKVIMGHENEEMLWEEDKTEVEEKKDSPNLIYGPQPQVVTNDLRNLDDMVRDLVERCTCPSQFPMVKVSEGKYRIGETKVLIFVRILRNHVMVRVGGGWDTLHHYLDKHDPCRCRSGHRTANLQRIGFKTQNDGDRQLKSVTYERNDEGYSSSPLPRRRSNGYRNPSEGQSSVRQRSQSPAVKKDYSPIVSSPRLGQRGHSVDDYGNNSDMWNDSSSEISDDGHTRKLSKRHSSSSDRHHSSLTQLSVKSSSASEDDLRIQPPPRRSLTNKPFSSTPSSSIPRNSSTTSKNRSSSFDNSIPKNYRDLVEARRQGAKASLGLRNSDAYSKKNSIPESTEARKISRSNSATSEGGFQAMLQKNMKGRQNVRGGNSSSSSPFNSGKNTWSGRSRQRNNTALHPDAFRPPPGVRSVRSASSSPAPTRKNYISSAPSTPANRSPKRRNNNSGTFSPPFPPEIMNKLPNVNGDPDTEILAQLEGFVNSYRAYVLDKLASEGRALPPDLSDKEWDKENDSQRDRQGTLKATPRKAGIGSRIPAPVF